MSAWQPAGDNDPVVVQCPTCQSKFRIADEKVTDRGVRVRCTSCKNVFQVRKPGSGADNGAPGPGSTLDLSSLGAAAIARTGGAGGARPPAAARPGTGPVKPSTGPVKPSTGPVKPSTGPVKPSTGPVKPSTGPVKPPTGPVKPPTGPVKPSTGPVKTSTGPLKPSTGPVKPSTGPVRTAARKAATTADGAARRLDVDDLFGMAELTGDAPLSSLAPPDSAPFPRPLDDAPPSGAAELDLELDAKPAAKNEPAGADAPLPDLDALLPTPHSDGVAPAPSQQLPLQDPLDVPAPERQQQSALELDGEPPKAAEPTPKADAPRRPITRPQPAKAPKKEPEIAPARTLVSSALTGLLGATLAIIVVIASALSGDAEAGWLGFGPASDVIATGVVSGLYDTAGGKPVFYVRGRIQNRSDRVRGPVRVTAELVGGDEQLRAETIAGAEPTPEDVWSVRSAADAEKLGRTLQSERVERKMQPGGNLPFFVLIPDPPADLQGRRLEIRVETVDAWTPQAAKAAQDR